MAGVVNILYNNINHDKIHKVELEIDEIKL